MRLLLTIFTVLFLSSAAMAQQQAHGEPKSATAPVTATTSFKMPEARSTELKALQAQADKMKSEFETAMRELQLRATTLITRAALEAHMTAEQLDSMDLALAADGRFEWRPKPPPR